MEGIVQKRVGMKLDLYEIVCILDIGIVIKRLGTDGEFGTRPWQVDLATIRVLPHKFWGINGQCARAKNQVLSPTYYLTYSSQSSKMISISPHIWSINRFVKSMMIHQD